MTAFDDAMISGAGIPGQDAPEPDSCRGWVADPNNPSEETRCGLREPCSIHGKDHDPATGEVPFEPDETPDRGWDRERHCITSLEGADWAGHRLREAQEQVALNEEMAEAEIEALNRKMVAVRERMKAADAPFRSAVAYFDNALRVYAETHRAEVLKGLSSKAKSRLLPSGVRIGWRKDSGGYRWDDAMPAAERKAKLLEWARVEEDATDEILIKSNPEPDLAEIKQHLAAFASQGRSLDVPPGLKYVPESETLEIVVKEPRP